VQRNKPPPELARAQVAAATLRKRSVLVVDDSAAQRMVLRLSLQRSGYLVTEASSACAAMTLCQTRSFDFVLSDWVMPEMSGVELCRALRQRPGSSYRYFILLTSKSEKSDVAEGLDAGADDLLSKPIDPDELQARMRAGERLLAMQEELVDSNLRLHRALDELNAVHEALDRDLLEARKLQQTLVRDRHRQFDGGSVSILLRPSGHVGGDLVGCFPITPCRIVAYSIDVAGHGVASAMMTARLAGLISGSTQAAALNLQGRASVRTEAWPPEMVADRLNRLMMEELQVDSYFTMAYAEIDLGTGRVMLVQAGHPHPVLLRADGRVEFVGQGGLPIGLVDGATYDRVTCELAPGDRLLLLSDGLTECEDGLGLELGEAGLAELISRSAPLTGAAFWDGLLWDLERFAGRNVFRDDLSGVLVAYRGP
jgi:sigma-B regulation protein RsbU (phosphoserine phosphatase)